MIGFFERWKLRKLLYSKVSLGVLALAVVYLGWIAFSAYQKSRLTHTFRSEGTEKLKELESRETALVAEIDRLKTPRGIEEEIRNKYEVAKEGEGVIVVVDAPGQEQEAQEENRGFFRSLFDFIF